jgi:diguanylate cyclase (GGDEF)-like protein
MATEAVAGLDLRLFGLAALAITAVSVLLLVRRYAIAAKQMSAAHEGAVQVALLDPLTKLPNRAAFRAQLDMSVRSGAPGTVALLYADLDHFKEVNDGLGHGAGDQLLEEVAGRFRSAIPIGDVLARIGGDEFAVVMSGAGVHQRASEVASAMIECVRKPFKVRGNLINIGVSIGISSDEGADRNHMPTPEELQRQADVALYKAKAETRMTFRRFEHSMDEVMVKKRAMNAHMKAALDERQFRLALQPIFSAQTGKLASAEALVRWSHPAHGDISPARFIPLAEESGQIYEIGAYVLRQAIAFAGQLGTVPIAINVSPLQFRNNNFAKTVADALLEASVSPTLIKIEITEGVLIKHTDAARTTLRQLRELGVEVVLDDFGTGFSSLSYLQNFPFDAIKIDRSFLRNLGTRSQATQLMRTMIELGHSQDMKVVAEGVENAWQISVLQLLGCDYLQGFFLGTPGDVQALLANPIVALGNKADVAAKLEPETTASNVLSMRGAKRTST